MAYPFLYLVLSATENLYRAVTKKKKKISASLWYKRDLEDEQKKNGYQNKPCTCTY